MNTAIAEAYSLSFAEKNKDLFHSAPQNNYLAADELSAHIHGCSLNDRISQKIIYESFYSYAKSICDRYASRNDDALEIVNDGFIKLFKEMYRYKPAYSDVVSSFKGWLRKIIIHTAIDHFRKNHKHDLVRDLPDNVIHMSSGYDTAVDNISYREIIQAIQKLTPGYRTIFNLFIIEGLTHIEISKMLGITVGASKSNLSKARRQLQKILARRNLVAVSSV